MVDHDPGVTCDDKYGADPKMKAELLDCLTSMHSLSCNPMFIQKFTELGYPQEFDHLSDADKIFIDQSIYKSFEPSDPALCATEDCSEF